MFKLYIQFDTRTVLIDGGHQARDRSDALNFVISQVNREREKERVGEEKKQTNYSFNTILDYSAKPYPSREWHYVNHLHAIIISNRNTILSSGALGKSGSQRAKSLASEGETVSHDVVDGNQI